MPSIYDIFGNASGLQGLLTDAQVSPVQGDALISAGLSLLAAGGPSDRPVSLGQALAGAYGKGREAFQSGIQNQVGNVLTAAKINQVKRQSDLQKELTALFANVKTPEERLSAYNSAISLAESKGDPEMAERLSKNAQALYERVNPKGVVVGEGGALINPVTGEQLFSQPRKSSGVVGEYQDAVKNGLFNGSLEQFILAKKEKPMTIQMPKPDKPAIALPPSVQKAEDEDFGIYDSAKNVFEQTGKYINSLASGQIPVTMGGTMSAKFLGAIGSNSPEVVAYNDFERFKTQLVNESLRLNKGTQTEGDAVRATQELMGARSEADAIAAMQRLQKINADAANRSINSIVRRRTNIGLPKPEMLGDTVNIMPIQLPKDSSAAAAAYNRLPSGSVYIDPQGNQRTKP